MSSNRWLWQLVACGLLLLWLVACGAAAPAAEPERIEVPVEVTRIVEGEPVTEAVIVTATPDDPLGETEPEVGEPTEETTEETVPTEQAAPLPTLPPATGGEEDPSPTQETVPEPTPPPPTLSVLATITPPLDRQEQVIEVEWPPDMRLGDSDIVRLTLVPTADGYEAIPEFPDTEMLTQSVSIPIREGYGLWGLARLDGPGFEIAPDAEQEQAILSEQPTTWQWTIAAQRAGQHRLALRLTLRWVPPEGSRAPTIENTVYTKGLTVQVAAFLGLTHREATMSGMVGLALGSTLTLPLLAYVVRPRRRALFREAAPNDALVIENHPTITLTPSERSLLRALFHAYARLNLEAEFRSGYSGARIFLVLPVRRDGRADAFTIAKLGERGAIEQEVENYETFVKNTLPPITARIQDAPVVLPAAGGNRWRREPGSDHALAALRYTFIGEPGRMPTSLRQALLADPRPDLLERLFQTFGPNWWMQRRPTTFRLGEEYDRMLPSHYLLEPAEGEAAPATLDGNSPPAAHPLPIGAVVTLRNVRVVEWRLAEGHLSLVGEATPGNPRLRLRVRCQSADLARRFAHPDGATVRVVATRAEMLRDLVAALILLDLPDPLPHLPTLLREQVFGSTSPIHGDLNLENVLVGLGDFVWLIDFALTREGHPLYDFAHLEANIIAHVLAPRTPDPATFLASLRAGEEPLLATLHDIARRCLFNPAQPREYHLALCLTCLGALKYRNLEVAQKQLLYLAAAHWASVMGVEG